MIQINLAGFLNAKNSRIFMGELWSLLDSAQTNELGIPQMLIDAKKRAMAVPEVPHSDITSSNIVSTV